MGATLHRWNVSPAAAAALQRRLAERVVREGEVGRLRYVAGADVAFSADGTRALAGAVVWDVYEQGVVEEATAWRKLTFPYVPGLLSFREVPALLAAIRKLRTVVDVYLFDGQGLAHPRRFGLACHAGIILDRPTVGCAKSLLVGAHGPLGSRRGSRQPLRDRGEVVGAVLRTRNGVKPIYVSVGHRLSLESAVRVVLACGGRFRIPEPTRLADALVGRLKRKEDGAGS